MKPYLKMMALAYADFKHIVLHIEKIILKYFPWTNTNLLVISLNTLVLRYPWVFKARYIHLFLKILLSQIFLFCWQIILLILSNIFLILLLFKADFLQCRSQFVEKKERKKIQ